MNSKIFKDLSYEFKDNEDHDEQETDIEGVRASAELVYKHIDVSSHLFVPLWWTIWGNVA